MRLDLQSVGRLRAVRSKGVTGSLKMDAVVHEDDGRGCGETKRDKHRVEMVSGGS